MAEVNNSPDQKDIPDLQARIGAEQIMLQNEMAKRCSQAEANQAMQNQRLQQMRVASSGEPFELDW